MPIDFFDTITTIEDINEGVVNFEGLLNERTDGVLHPSIHRRGILSPNYLRPAESIVFCNVDKLGSVGFTGLVYGVSTSAFITREIVSGENTVRRC